jgi:Tryptophan-associated transmembrane protein (Trp_oprn_chp)
MLLALGLTALGAALVLATAGQPRWSADRLQLVGGGAPAATALALVALAGIGLLFLLAGRARSIIGLLLMLTGGAVVLVDLYIGRGFFAYSSLRPGPLDLHRSVWFWLTAAGGVLVAGGGLLIAVWGHRWPGTRRSYVAPADPSPVHRDAWTALDRGEDPTI